MVGAVAAHEGGFDTFFVRMAWREVVMVLGGFIWNRVHYSVNLIGGVKVDINDVLKTAILKGWIFSKIRTEYYI